MIEAFYTKNLKSLVRKLHSRNALNSMALNKLNDYVLRYIFRWLILFFSLSIVIFISVFIKFGFLASILSWTIVSVVLMLEFNSKISKFCKLICLITEGKKLVAQIVDIQDISPSFVTVGWYLKYEFRLGDQNYSNLHSIDKDIVSTKPDFDKTIEIAYEDNNPNINAPCLPEYKEFFNIAI